MVRSAQRARLEPRGPTSPAAILRDGRFATSSGWGPQSIPEPARDWCRL